MQFYGHQIMLPENTRYPLRKLNVLVLTWEYPPHIVGGLARHVYGLTKSLSRKNVSIHVITTGQEGLPSDEEVDGVFIHRVMPLNETEKNFIYWVGGLNLALIDKAEKLKCHYHFDLIHAHDWLVGGAARTLKAYWFIPLITTIHGTESGRNNGIYTEMQKIIHDHESKLVKESDQLIVCSDYMREEVKRLFQPIKERVVVISNGIDDDFNKNAKKNPLAGFPVQLNRRMIFSIGRMVREKGFDTIIEAAVHMKALREDVYFIIAGKGPMLEEYRRMVIENDLMEMVFLVGFVDDDQRNALFQLCDIAVFPSRYEPFGIVALEAMMAGKPTIVSRVGGLKGIVQHQKTGMFMSPGSSESLVKQLLRLLDQLDFAQKIAEEGQKYVQRFFSWNRVAEETKEVYQNILDEMKSSTK